MEASASALLGALREHTQQKHEQLDSLLSGRAFQSEPSYVRFLVASFRAASPLETAIAARLGGDFEPERAPRLRADLRTFDVDVARETLQSTRLDSDAAAWGAAYVLEGSALGGVVLAASVERELGSQVARSYLTLRGPQTASRWRWFLRMLGEFAERATVPDRISATQAASSAFDAYLSAFSREFPAT